MNREILFRGKRIDKPIYWVEGYYCKIKDEDNILDSDACFHKVIPETVGQYTGLRKMNRKTVKSRLQNIIDELVSDPAYICKNCGFVTEIEPCLYCTRNKLELLKEKIKERIRIEKRDRTFGHNIYSKALEWVLSEIKNLKRDKLWKQKNLNIV